MMKPGTVKRYKVKLCRQDTANEDKKFLPCFIENISHLITILHLTHLRKKNYKQLYAEKAWLGTKRGQIMHGEAAFT